jgi:hypothetical protein
MSEIDLKCGKCRAAVLPGEACPHRRCPTCRGACCGETTAVDARSWALFALRMQLVREEFPEHGREIDRAVYDAGQKLDSCGDPNCTCRMTFENFRAAAEQSYRARRRF